MKRVLVSLLLVAAVLAVGRTGDGGARPVLPEAGMAKKRSVEPGVQGFDKQHGPHSQFECIATSGGANTKLDCDDPFPNNEPDIEVDPANPQHVIASSNDYGSCCDQMLHDLRRRRDLDDGEYLAKSPQVTGSDPVTVFDRKNGAAIHSSLNYSFQNSTGELCRRRPGRLRVDGRRGGLAAADRRRERTRLRPLQRSVLQRQGVDRHRQQPGFAVLRADLSDLDAFDAASGAYTRSAIFESHSGRRRQALDEAAGDLRVERQPVHVPG